MKKITILLLILCLLSTTMFISLAHSVNQSQYVSGNQNYIWACYANASFDSNTGKFLGHGTLTNINVPPNTPTYTYYLVRYIRGNDDYTAYQTVKAFRERNDGQVLVETRYVNIKSPGFQ